MPEITLTKSEVDWLARNTTRKVLSERVRRVILFDRLDDRDGPFYLRLSKNELWAIDDVLVTDHDLRGEKLSDGLPLVSFAEKVWTLLTREVNTDAGDEDANSSENNAEAKAEI